MTTKRQKPETYALTMVTHQRWSLFQRTEDAQLMVDTLFRYHDQGRFLHAFVVMPDHFHTMIIPAEDHATSRCVQLIKSGFSFAVREQFKGEVWTPDATNIAFATPTSLPHKSSTLPTTRAVNIITITSLFVRDTKAAPTAYPITYSISPRQTRAYPRG